MTTVTPIVTAEVLRVMVVERVQAFHLGEISLELLRGYVIAMFHAGVLTSEEAQHLASGPLDLEQFQLTPPEGHLDRGPRLREPEPTDDVGDA